MSLRIDSSLHKNTPSEYPTHNSREKANIESKKAKLRQLCCHGVQYRKLRNNMPAGFKRSRALWDETKNGGIPAWINAICYELQPMRLSKSSKEEALATLLSLVHFTFSVIKGILPLCKSILSFISQLSLRHWMVVGVIFGYYWLVRWIHE